jgi:hypothetical protein
MKGRWARVAVALALAVLGAGVAAGAAEVREVGLRVDLSLQPLYAGSEVHWNFDIGAYALVAFNPTWGVRASAGFDVLSAGPYVGVGLLRALGPHLALEGDILVQWSFASPTPVATAGAGARFAGAGGGLFYQLAAFPVSWTLASVAGAPAMFSFSPSFTVGGGFELATGLQFGQAATITFLRIPPLAVRPVLSAGAGWMLSARITSNLGWNLATP